MIEPRTYYLVICDTCRENVLEDEEGVRLAGTVTEALEAAADRDASLEDGSVTCFGCIPVGAKDVPGAVAARLPGPGQGTFEFGGEAS